MKYSAIVFDLDGTLLNTLEDLADALNRVLAAKGLPCHPLEAYRTFVGSGAAKLVSRALPPAAQRNDALRAECLAAFRKEYQKNWNQKTHPYEGVAELLDGLTVHGIKMAILTNKPQHFADLCMQAYFSGWQFAMICGQRDGIPMKPDPAGPREILRHLGMDGPACVYVGDSDIDMATALNAQMLPVGALWGFRSEKELRDAGAVEVIGHPTDLLELVV